MSDPFIGQIHLFGFNFAPRGWAFCDGQLLPIAQHTALFSLLGTMYGGDGRTTFGLPDLKGRSAIHAGQGPGLSNVTQGAKGGAESHTLTIGQLPPHSHTVACFNDEGDNDEPAGLYLAQDGEEGYSDSQDAGMAAGMIANTGNGSAFSLRNPSLGIYHSIALQGTYPSRP